MLTTGNRPFPFCGGLLLQPRKVSFRGTGVGGRPGGEHRTSTQNGRLASDLRPKTGGGFGRTWGRSPHSVANIAQTLCQYDANIVDISESSVFAAIVRQCYRNG